MNEILLKVNGISSLTDARYCAGMGVQKLGISFNHSGTGSMDPNQFASVKAWIEGVSWTGTYLGMDMAVFKNLVEQYQIFEWVISPELLHLDFDFSKFKLYLKAQNKTEISFLYPVTIDGFEISAKVDLLKEGLDNIILLLGKHQELYVEDIPDAEFVIESHNQFPGVGFTLVSGEEERPGWMDLSDLQDMLEHLEKRT